MKFKKPISIFLASLLLATQLPLVALADTPSDPSTTTDPSATQTTQPSDPQTPAPAPAPDPSTTGQTGSGTSSSQPPTNQPGPTSPPGADANQYTFNPATGMWESAQYIWNLATGQTTPKSDPGYYYNPATGMWDTTTYQYHPETKSYQPVTVSSSTNPNPTTSTGGDGTTTNATSTPGIMSALASLFGGDPSNSNTGPNSTNTINAGSNNNAFFDNFSKAIVQNNLTSGAQSGNASVSGNTTAGDATTGPATVISNLFNLLNSAWSWSTGGLSYFVQNLFGNQNGNILVSPQAASGGGGGLGSLAGGTTASNTGTGPGSSNTIGVGNDNSLTVNNQASGTINNNVNAMAQSGNASVNGNTTGGNATSGDAAADVNILNLINSAIGAGQSFFGVVNVFGNLSGDILFPQGFLDSIAASGQAPTTTASNSGTGPDSNNTVNGTTTNNVDVSNNQQNAINNNIQAAAQSGNANVSNNTTAGSATTGAASTNTDAFNFAGNLVGDNAVLVLVNVLGHWVGGILNLPGSGSSQAALLTGGASNLSNSDTGPNSSNSINNSTNNNVNVANSAQNTINNNITAGAKSGNADVTDNTTGGNATSGSANVAANVANFVGSTLNLSHWFGVLMINVFGNWDGSVSTQTPEVAAVTTTSGTTGGQPNLSKPIVHVSNLGGSTTGSGIGSNVSHTKTSVNPDLAAAKVVNTAEQAAAVHQSRQVMLLGLIAAAMMLLAGMMAAFERRLGNKA